MAVYVDALKVFTRGQTPFDWAMIHNNLGTISGMLGERESGKEHLTRSVTFFREALKALTRDRAPLYWAHDSHRPR